MPPPNVYEVFPAQDVRAVDPRHPKAWVRIRGEWRKAIVVCWYRVGPVRSGARIELHALLQWDPPQDDEPDTVMVAYLPGAILPRHTDTPPAEDTTA